MPCHTMCMAVVNLLSQPDPKNKNHGPRFGTENLEHTDDGDGDGENVAAIGKPYLTTSFRGIH